VSPEVAATSRIANWPRLRRFVDKPWPEKVRSAGLYCRNAFPNLPIPVRLPFGSWWLAWQNDLGNHVLAGDYESAEYTFVEEFLRPGMVVLDIGANEGFYTLLASHCVGATGQVVAFEPSPRERRRLRMNSWLNRFRNVRVEGKAVAAQEGEMKLFVVESRETGCNSLRPPGIQGSTSAISIEATTLDLFVRRNGLERVDFMKIDVEGAELSVLQGAVTLLQAAPRPFMMIEVSDLRTRPWGYSSREIANFLRHLEYDLFRPLRIGELEPLDVDDIKDGSDFNAIAAPRERVPEITSLSREQGN